MAGRSKRKKSDAARVIDERHLLYRSVFIANPMMLQRLDALASGDADPLQDSSNSQPLEATLGALFSGKKPNRLDFDQLIAPVAASIEEAYLLRAQRSAVS